MLLLIYIVLGVGAVDPYNRMTLCMVSWSTEISSSFALNPSNRHLQNYNRQYVQPSFFAKPLDRIDDSGNESLHGS